MKLYVCGPVTGFSDLNLPLFEAALDQLDSAGYEAVVPHEFVHPDENHAAAMDLCLARLEVGDIDGIALLPGWSDSAGSCQEVERARALGIEPKSIDQWLFEAETMGQRADNGQHGRENENDGSRGETFYLFGVSGMNNGYMEFEEENGGENMGSELVYTCDGCGQKADRDEGRKQSWVTVEPFEGPYDRTKHYCAGCWAKVYGGRRALEGAEGRGE